MFGKLDAQWREALQMRIVQGIREQIAHEIQRREIRQPIGQHTVVGGDEQIEAGRFAVVAHAGGAANDVELPAQRPRQMRQRPGFVAVEHADMDGMLVLGRKKQARKPFIGVAHGQTAQIEIAGGAGG